MTGFYMECNTGIKYVKGTLIQMWKLGYADAHREKQYLGNCVFLILTFSGYLASKSAIFFEAVCFLRLSIVLTSV